MVGTHLFLKTKKKCGGYSLISPKTFGGYSLISQKKICGGCSVIFSEKKNMLWILTNFSKKCGYSLISQKKM